MNLNQLWDKCSYCRVCQDHTHEITVSLFPDRSFKGLTFIKSGNTLTLSSYLKIGTYQLHITHTIDCLNDTFEFSADEETERGMDLDKSLAEEQICYRVDRSYAEFWLDGNCRKCRSHICTNDIPLNLKTRKLENLGIETETIQLKPYEIICHPDRNEMEVSKKENLYTLTITYPPPKRLTLPLIELDFTNPKEAIDHLETLLVFA